MGPKAVAKKKVVEAEVVQEQPEEEREPSPYDPYKGLRYEPLPRKVPPRRKLKVTKIPVLKPKPGSLDSKYKRSGRDFDNLIYTHNEGHEKPKIILSIPSSPLTLSSVFSGYKDKKAPNYVQLDPAAGVRGKLTRWVPATETALKQLPKLALLHSPTSGGTIHLLGEQSRDKEAHSLAHYEQMRKSQLVLENYLMKKVNKSRGNLLLRRDQVLPCIEPGGREMCVHWREICESPPPEKPPMLNIFTFHDKGNERRGLLATMSRRERGHNVITEWIGPPQVTDVIMRELGLVSTGSLCLKSHEEKPMGGGPLKGKTGEFVPDLAALAVVGVACKNAAERSTLKNASPAKGSQPTQPKRRDHRGDRESDTGLQTYIDSRKTFAMQDMDSARDRGVVLYFGNHRLSWHDATASEVKKSRIVEIGSTAEYGRCAVSSTIMRNAGTVVIQYNWVKCSQSDPFELGRYTQLRFAFDNWRGVILPGETHRVPCLFKANDFGYFTEDWRLVTQPVLEGGEPIILRLWGITRQKATKLSHKEIEQRLHSLITKSVAAQRVQKIIDYLPLKEIPLKNIRFPLRHLGADLFHLKNPFLHYNSASVFRLSRMVEMFNSINLSKRGSSCSASDITSSAASFSSPGSDHDYFYENIADKHQAADIKSKSKVSAKWIFPGDITQIKSVETMGSKKRSTVSSQRAVQLKYVVDNDGSHAVVSDETILEDIGELMKKLKIMSDLDHFILETPTKTSMKQSILSGRSPRGSEDNAEDEESKSSTEKSDLQEMPERPNGYVNVVDPDISITALRKQILDTDRLEVQEASFQIFSEEISKLSFRPHSPKENWKQTVGFTYLCHVFDSFSDFAESLRVECCRGQLHGEIARRREQEMLLFAAASSVFSHGDQDEVHGDSNIENIAEEKNANNTSMSKLRDETYPDTAALAELHPVSGEADEEQSMKGSTNVSSDSTSSLEFFLDHCQKKNPRDILMKDRYQDQYYNRLHSRMYQLLSDFFDTMDSLWTAKTELKMNQDELGFIKIRNIDRCANIEDLLSTPLPPAWIRLAQRMDNVAASNKHRILQSKLEGHH